MQEFKRLVISGGGPRGLALLGALHYFDECKCLDTVEEYWGTSVGSLISLLLSIGYSPFDAFHQIFVLQNLADISKINFQETISSAAICPIDVIGDKVRFFLREKLGADWEDPTFTELYAHTGKKIHIMGANTTTMRGECFSVDTTPDMKLTDAIEISCDLPYIFTKKEHNGSIYVDGSFINAYPIDLADNGTDPTLGVCVFGDLEQNNSHIGWLYRLMYMPIRELHRERLSRISRAIYHIELNINGISIIELSPNPKKKLELFTQGYQQTKERVAEKEREAKFRRESLQFLEQLDAGKYWDLEDELF